MVEQGGIVKSFDFDVGGVEVAFKLEAIKCAVDAIESIAKSLEVIAKHVEQQDESQIQSEKYRPGWLDE